jgi:hypothetical protein
MKPIATDTYNFEGVITRGYTYVETQLEIAVRLGFREDASDSFALIEEIRAMLITMITKLRGGAQ